MLSKFHQNAILTGCVDSVCLVCESHLRSEEDASSHITKPVHVKNLGSCMYLEKFPGDHVRKVKKGYFCEFCNLLLPTAAKVSMHVTETSHADNKGAQLIKRSGNNIIIFDSIIITEQAWNGLMLDTCAVCNVEFTNLKLHVAEQKHILNLIQKKVEFEGETTVYRKIDNTAGHCLVCNSIIALNTLPSHYEEEIHRKHVDDGQKLYQAFLKNNNSNQPKNFKDKEEKTEPKNKTSEKSKDNNANKPENIKVKEQLKETKIKTSEKAKDNNANKPESNKGKELIKETKIKTSEKAKDNNANKPENMKDKEQIKETKLKTSEKVKDNYANKPVNIKDKEQIKETKIKTPEKAKDNISNKPVNIKDKEQITKTNNTTPEKAKDACPSGSANKKCNTTLPEIKKETSSVSITESPKTKKDLKIQKCKACKDAEDDTNIELAKYAIECRFGIKYDKVPPKPKKPCTCEELNKSSTNKAKELNKYKLVSMALDDANPIEKVNTGIQKEKPITDCKPTQKTATDNREEQNTYKIPACCAQANKDKIFEYVTEFQKNGVNINFETETAFCKKCFVSVDLDIAVIKQHIDGHKTKPKMDLTANTIHYMNQNYSRTDLNDKEKDVANAKPPAGVDQNHNETKNKSQKQEEEIIKIDLTKKSEDSFEETSDNAIVQYVPGAAGSQLKEPKETPKPTPKATVDTNDPETFAKEHSMTYNKGNGNAYCRICSTRVPAAIKNMKEHVSGMSHKTKVARIAEMERAKSNVPKKAMAKFIYQRSTVINVFGIDDVILNDKYCLTRMSFYMITTHKRLRCQACEVNLTKEGVLNHVDGVFHERAMERTPVVTSLQNEFVREVRPGLFHCGFCNLVVGEWEAVNKHISCSEHQESKRSADSRLGQHLPGILEHRASREQIYRNAFPQLWPFF